MTQGIFAVFWDMMLFSLVKTVFLRGSACHQTLLFFPAGVGTPTVFVNFCVTAGHRISSHSTLFLIVAQLVSYHVQFLIHISVRSLYISYVRATDPSGFKHYIS
jgi:hypothetical protein